MRTNALRLSCLAVIGLATLSVAGTGQAWAGPARYDADSRSIRFNYTYAALVEGQFGDAAIGAPQKPTTEQDAKVRTIVLKVSDALSKVTAGRLKIASLDLVSDVKSADIVLSLTGKPGRGGWAMTGAIEGRPGQIGLYYQTLADEWEQDIILTAAHEICHYIFGFVDEYNFPNGCPVSNPGGPGCLMDNYLSQGTRHGWYGRLCAGDHYQDASQRQSCQQIVDKFFTDRKVTTSDPGSDPTVDPTSTATAATSTTNKTKSAIDNITRAAIGKVREEAEARIKDKKGGAALTSVTALRGFAKTFLDSQLKLNQVGVPSHQLTDLVDGVLKQAASLVKVAIPARFDPLVNLIAKFAENRAKELREQSPKDSDSSRRQKIVKGLTAFLSGLSSAGNAPTITGALTADEKKYLEHVAMQAATQTDDEKLNDELFQAAMSHIKLSRETAGTVLDIAGEVGVVGIENRLAALGEVDADLRKFLPGRTASTGFGRRRTIVIDPDALDPQQDFVVTQSGIYRYSDLRDQYVDLFSKLVERARIELLTTDLQKRRQENRRKSLDKPAGQRSVDERIRRIAELADRSKVRSQREAELRATIGELTLQVRRNRLENIIFIVPPGGLPRDMGDLFESLRRQLIVKGDIRLDVVLVNSADIPPELRDIAIGSGGSIVTLADVDEVGAISQRLKNEQTSGAWVILPFQSMIRGAHFDDSGRPVHQRPVWLLQDPARGPLIGTPIAKPLQDVKERLCEIRKYFEHEDIKKDCQPVAESATTDLRRASIMPPDAIEVLVGYAKRTLVGGQPSDDASKTDDASKKDADSVVNLAKGGLVKEIERLEDVVNVYNARKQSSGDQVKFGILEHVIQARMFYSELKSLLNIALASHEKLVSSSYDEDHVFKNTYNLENIRKHADSPIETANDKVEKLTDEVKKAEKVAADAKSERDKAEEGAEEPANQKLMAANSSRRKAVKELENAKKELKLAKENKKSSFATHLNLAVQNLKDQIEITDYNEATKTYLALKVQEVRLRAVGRFLDQLEEELAMAEKTPLFRRIDRDQLVRANQQIQDANPGFIEQVPGQIRPRPLKPAVVTDDKKGPIGLPRFYAENVVFDPSRAVQTEFELILGFSEPLPGLDATALRDNNTQVIPKLQLYSDDGQLVNTPTLKLDRDLSTPTCLIYHFSPEFGEKGWYTGALLVDPTTLRRMGQDSVNFTFSVASTRPNFRLNAALVQVPNDPELIPPPPNRGLARVMDRRAKVEVQVYGGTSVLGASIRGVLHKLDDGTDPINPITQKFYDDGKTFQDLKADDGIYTTIIALDQIEKGMEYRVLIQAESVEGKSKNIPPEDPGKNDVKRRELARAQGVKDIRDKPGVEVATPQPEDALKFQRATSIQIRVEH